MTNVLQFRAGGRAGGNLRNFFVFQSSCFHISFSLLGVPWIYFPKRNKKNPFWYSTGSWNATRSIMELGSSIIHQVKASEGENSIPPPPPFHSPLLQEKKVAFMGLQDIEMSKQPPLCRISRAHQSLVYRNKISFYLAYLRIYLQRRYLLKGRTLVSKLSRRFCFVDLQ